MIALILNSGLGTRMGDLTSTHPKCMTALSTGDTILSRQLRQLSDACVTKVVMTVGPFEEILKEYVESLNLPIEITFVKNPKYRETNYIYSIYCAREYLQDDILLLHGDLVFEDRALAGVVSAQQSCMAVSSACPLPEKDFKAVIQEGRIEKVGIEFFESALAAQPMYKLLYPEWACWLGKIEEYCQNGTVKCYAENALNEVLSEVRLYPMDVENLLCREVDSPQDLDSANRIFDEAKDRTVYLCFSTDLLHSGHISLINRAARLGSVMVGVLSDEVVASYKRFPLVPFSERKRMFEAIKGVDHVMEQHTLSYREILEKYRPDYVVHGDDWKSGFQRPVRDEVEVLLTEYGGTLVEYPYSRSEELVRLENRVRTDIATPDQRRGRLKRLIEMKGLVTALEAHSGITGLIAENTAVYQNGTPHQFDAMWVSSLCDSTAKGKPDIELVDMTSRFRTIDDIMEVTTKPIIFDGDTGGLTEHFVYTVKSLERMGVSMVIIEDKTGLKKNSLFGTEVEQTQDSIENFSAKIAAGKRAQKTHDFMICARIESLILERGMEDALMRAQAFVEAGADAIMIHSRKKKPDEIFRFIELFRAADSVTPLVVVPTSFNSVTEEEFKKRGVNVVIYANQLTRSGIPAMDRAAKMILEHHRAQECDELCMPIKEILTLIPEDT